MPTTRPLLRALLLTTFLVLCGPGRSLAQVPPGLEGRWSGAAIENGTPILFELEFEVVDDSLHTTLTQPYSGYSRFPYPFRYEGGRLKSGLFGDEMDLLVDLRRGQLRGTVVNEGEVTQTVFLQRVLDFPLPGIREEEVSFRAGSDTLAGSLLLPDGPGPYPAIVFVAGRGYGSRYGSYDLASTLVRFGIAGLVVDARGTGRSTGDNATATSLDRVEDVAAGLDFMRDRSEISSDHLGLLSNSAGGWIVPVVAAERNDVAFIVTLVGPAESLAYQQGHVIEALMRRSDESFTDDEFRAAFEYQKRLVELSYDGAEWSAFKPLIETARSKRWARFVDLPESLANPELDYYRRRQDYDPTEALRNTRIPLLAIYCEDDYVVPPEVNVPVLQNLLEEAGNADFEIVVLAEVNHSIALTSGFVGDGEWPDRYYQPWTRSPDLIPTILDWLRPRLELDRPRNGR